MIQMIQDDVDDFGMIQKMLDDLEKTSPYLSPHSLKLECRPSPGTHPTAFCHGILEDLPVEDVG